MNYIKLLLCSFCLFASVTNAGDFNALFFPDLDFFDQDEEEPVKMEEETLPTAELSPVRFPKRKANNFMHPMPDAFQVNSPAKRAPIVYQASPARGRADQRWSTHPEEKQVTPVGSPIGSPKRNKASGYKNITSKKVKKSRRKEQDNDRFLNAKANLDASGFSLNFLGSGQYHDVYSVSAEEGVRLIPEIANEKIVVKILNETKLAEHPTTRKRIEFFQNAYSQWQQVREHINCITYYNNPITDGYAVVNRFDNTLEKYFEENDFFRGQELEEDSDAAKIIKEAMRICAHGVKNSINLDAKPDNFGITEDGRLVLADFREEHNEADDAEINQIKYFQTKFFAGKNDELQEKMLRYYKDNLAN